MTHGAEEGRMAVIAWSGDLDRVWPQATGHNILSIDESGDALVFLVEKG